MPYAGTSRAAVRAILLTFALVFIYKCASHYIFIYIFKTLRDPFYELPEDLIAQFLTMLPDDDTAKETAFFTYELLRQCAVTLMLLPLEYQYYLRLEAALPMRWGRHRHDAATHADQAVETSPEVEEKIMRRLVAEGKVRRSSINWCNTFLKLVLTLVVATPVHHYAHNVLFNVLQRKSWADIYSPPIVDMVTWLFVQFLTLRPLALLAAFVVVPARHRPPFLAACDILQLLFCLASLHIFLKTAITMTAGSPEIQEIVRNATLESQRQRQALSAALPIPTIEPLDEL